MRTKRGGGFVDERHAASLPLVAGKVGADFVKEAAVDFIDDFQMARQEAAEEVQRPFFKRFRKKGVVGVAEGLLRDVPGCVPGHVVFSRRAGA